MEVLGNETGTVVQEDNSIRDLSSGGAYFAVGLTLPGDGHCRRCLLVELDNCQETQHESCGCT